MKANFQCFFHFISLVVAHKLYNLDSFHRKKFPNHKFIGEESTAAAQGQIGDFTDDPTWIIDPIDGTMNFVHRYILYSLRVSNYLTVYVANVKSLTTHPHEFISKVKKCFFSATP